MWLKSLRKVPLGPFTMTVRPFSETLTGNQRQRQVNRLRGQHPKTPFKGTRRRTLLGDVNGLVAENGLHSAKDNRKKLQTLQARPFSCAPSAPPPRVPRNAQLRGADPTPPPPPPPPSRHGAGLRFRHGRIPPRPQGSGEKRPSQRPTPQRGPARA